eukprot:2749019-Pyramimonas_sp.AAC.1
MRLLAAPPCEVRDGRGSVSALVRAMRRCPGHSTCAQRHQDAPPWSFTSLCGSWLRPLRCEKTARPVT